MASNDIRKVKEVLDLYLLLEELGEDRPSVGVMLRHFGIRPETMSAAVITSTKAANITYPDTAIQIINDLFKLGVTLGYKYAVGTMMEREFGSDCPPDSEE